MMMILFDFVSVCYVVDLVMVWVEDVVVGLIVVGLYVCDVVVCYMCDLEYGFLCGFLWDVVLVKNVIGWFVCNLCLNGGQFEGLLFVLYLS